MLPCSQAQGWGASRGQATLFWCNWCSQLNVNLLGVDWLSWGVDAKPDFISMFLREEGVERGS